MSQPSPESIAIVDVPERSRFEIAVDGTFAGFTEYVDRDVSGEGGESSDRGVERRLPHTVIEKEFGGRGLATMLIATALDAARVDNLAVIPECSAVQHFIAERPDYVDLVPAARRAEFDL